MQNKLYKNLYYLSYVVLAILIIFFFRLVKIYDIFCIFLSIILPVLFGYIFAWILFPIYEKLNKKIDKRLSILIFISCFILLYALIIWKLIPIFISNGKNLIDILSSYIDKFSEISFLSNLKSYTNFDLDVIIESCSNLVSAALMFCLIHIFGFYLLYSYESVNSFLRSIIPKKYKRITLEYIRKLSFNMRFFIKGTLLDTFILFVISSILYALIGLKYPIMLAFFSAITNIIPFIGPYIGGIPAVMVGLGTSMKLGIITTIVIIFAQTIESNIINPMIMSKCISVNPILIIISLTIMGKFFGLFGMIFAVPTIIILKLSYEFYQKYKKVTD